jgi:hypothetical protein
MHLTELNKKEKKLLQQQSELYALLENEPIHRTELLQKINNVSVKLYTIRFQEQNLKRNAPVLGEYIGLDSKQLTQQSTRTNKQS